MEGINDRIFDEWENVDSLVFILNYVKKLKARLIEDLYIHLHWWLYNIFSELKKCYYNIKSPDVKGF